MKNFYINYPKNRGIIKFNFDNLFGIINDIDHFKLYCHIEKIENGEQLIQYFINIIEILNEIGREINFEFNKKFGYLTSNPHFIGNGMRIQIDLKLNNLNEEINILNENKDFKWEKINDGYIRLENLISIGISEVEMLCNLIVYIKQLIEMDGKRT
jgi:protein arginine kinase